MKIIKCYFQSCKETIEVDVDDAPQANGSASVLAAAATFGHSQYQRVPFARRDGHRLSGKPWTCAFHDAMTSANLGLSQHEERQRQALIGLVRSGKMVKGEDGWYVQAAMKPVKPYTIREDNGDIREHGMVKWFSQEEMLAAMNPEGPAPTDYTVFATDPPPGVKPEPTKVSDDGESA